MNEEGYRATSLETMKLHETAPDLSLGESNQTCCSCFGIRGWSTLNSGGAPLISYEHGPISDPPFGFTVAMYNLFSEAYILPLYFNHCQNV